MNRLRFDMERDDLADRLGGGLPVGSIIVIEGEHGAGKSILVQRLTAGLVENKHSVSLISAEMTTAGFLAQMQSLAYPITEPLTEERLVFIPAFPVLGARAPKHDMLRRIVMARMMYTKDVVIFDSLSKFLADHLRTNPGDPRAAEQIESMLVLFKRLTSMGKTIILTFESGQVPADVAASFKESADLFLSIKSELVGNTVDRRIVVQRLSRALGRFGDVIGFRVEPGLGIVVEIKSVV